MQSAAADFNLIGFCRERVAKTLFCSARDWAWCAPARCFFLFRRGIYLGRIVGVVRIAKILARSIALMIFHLRSLRAVLTTRNGSVFVENPSSGFSHALNPPERMIWELLDGEHSVCDIAAEVGSAFKVSSDQSLADVSTFICKLTLMGCLDP